MDNFVPVCWQGTKQTGTGYFQVFIHLRLLVEEPPGRGEGFTVDTCHNLTGGLVSKENARSARSRLRTQQVRTIFGAGRTTACQYLRGL